MLTLLLLACTGAPADDTATPNTADTADTDTGGSPAPDCDFLVADTRLVLETACVDGVCAGSDYPEVVAVWGEPDSCTTVPSRATCAWGDVAVDFPDCDDDGEPDSTYVCDMFDQTVTIGGTWDGASERGLGLGIPAECWAEALGPEPTDGWPYGFNPWWTVSVEPDAGPVTSITIAWNWDE